MTTIVYKDGVLAFDSRCTADTTLAGKMTKGRLTKNFMIAAAGSAQDVQAFLDWAEAGFKEDDKKKFGLHEREVDIEGIIIDRKGHILHFEDRLYPFQVDAPFHALGSGGCIALGAMAAGASAYKAIKIASTYDTATGGDIKLLSFRKPKTPKDESETKKKTTKKAKHAPNSPK